LRNVEEYDSIVVDYFTRWYICPSL